VELGMVHIDTAEMYGDGGSESLIGEAIRDLPRESLFLVSKVLPSNASYDGTIRACDRSLKRMGIAYFDAYLLHWRGGYPLADTIGALERLIADGKIRHLGVSNFDLDDLREAQSLLTRETIACNQVLYHLTERTVERHELPYCREHGIALVGYTPFGRGDYADRPGAAELTRIAQKYGVSVPQVILAFLTREPHTFAIPKAAKIAHVEENAGAGTLVLDPDDIGAIDAAYPVRTRRGGLPTL
jgi:diketogulonate reductase-like aldo/keto reductase